jgi:hypothetical protein
VEGRPQHLGRMTLLRRPADNRIALGGDAGCPPKVSFLVEMEGCFASG